MLLEVNVSGLCLPVWEMHLGACQLSFVLILSQNLSVQCSVFILSHLSEFFDLKVCLLSCWVDVMEL